MKRKTFIQALAVMPMIGAPLKTIAAIFSPKDGCKTEKDVEGPFYKADAPARSLIETKGEALRIEGKVFSGATCQTPVPNAILDIWHCDNHGEYDMKGYNGRGQVKTDQQGNYSFTTIFPPPYGSRPRHIHFKIRAAGLRELTTQLYFQGDPNIQNDFARNADKSRIITLQPGSNLKRGVFNIYL